MVSKKNVTLAIFLLSFLIIGVGFASATTDYFYPTSGIDTTGSGTYHMSSSDLAKVDSSDNVRYESYGNWNTELFGCYR